MERELITEEWLTRTYSLEVLDPNRVTGWLVTELAKPGCHVTTVRVVTLDDEAFMVEIAQHDPDDEPSWATGIAFHVRHQDTLCGLVTALEATN